MLLSQGKVITGVGGGLCQLSNFLCWLLLHAQTKVIERYHHSFDVFPDSGRVLPFGSGATCLYNFIDLQIQNISPFPLQLVVWVTDTHLKGELRSTSRSGLSYSIREQSHCFIKNKKEYFRYNEIMRVTSKEGKEISKELIFINFAPVLYEVTNEYIKNNKYTCIDVSGSVE